MKENENKVMESFYHYIGENHINHVAEEFDRISADASEISCPSTLDAWFEDYNKQIKKIDQKRKFRAWYQLLSKRVAIFIAIALVGMFVTTMSVEAFRIRLFNIVTEVTDKYTKVSIVEKEGLLTLIWTTDEKTFHIIGEIERAEIIKMAESLKYFSK